MEASDKSVSGYGRPPITEAVIGITFESPIEMKLLDSVKKKYTEYYPQCQSVANYRLNVEIDEQNTQTNQPIVNSEQDSGYRLSSKDMTQLLLVWPSNFTISQLAPYSGWDEFIVRFVRDWKKWKRVIGHKKIRRIGVRYINRIDIPSSGTLIEYEHYLHIYPKLPDLFPPLNSYNVQCILPVENIGCQLRLNSSVVPSPILNHASFIIDQDIFMDSNVPQKDSEIFELLNLIRDEKNRVFESCISDKARGLFQQ